MRRLLSKKAKPPTLMLTPLLDMFTIILIFLIVSFSAEDYDFKLDETLQLPESSARTVLKPSISLAISKRAITVEGDKILDLDDYHLKLEHYASGEIPELVALLSKYYADLYGEPPPEGTEESELAATPADGAEPPEEVVITVQADQRLDYRTLYVVLQSAARAGFFKYRLAVLRR